MLTYNLGVEHINLFIKLSLSLVVLRLIRWFEDGRGHRRQLCVWLHDNLVLLGSSPVARSVLMVERSELRRLLVVLTLLATWPAFVTLTLLLLGCIPSLSLLVLPLVDEVPRPPRLASRLLWCFDGILRVHCRRSLWSVGRPTAASRLGRLNWLSLLLSLRLLLGLLSLRLGLFLSGGSNLALLAVDKLLPLGTALASSLLLYLRTL